MRDVTILGTMAGLEQKFRHDVSILFTENMRVFGRIRAIEETIFDTRLGFLRFILMMILSPKVARETLILRHVQIMKQMKADMEKNSILTVPTEN